MTDNSQSKEEITISGEAEKDHLLELYKQYQSRFFSDNNRIWTTAAMLIPLTLSPFVALMDGNEFSSVQLCILIVISSLFLISWLAIAESHKQYQERSMKIMTQIESKLGLSTNFDKKIKFGAKYARWFMATGIWLAWVLVYIYWPRQ